MPRTVRRFPRSVLTRALARVVLTNLPNRPDLPVGRRSRPGTVAARVIAASGGRLTWWDAAKGAGPWYVRFAYVRPEWRGKTFPPCPVGYDD